MTPLTLDTEMETELRICSEGTGMIELYQDVMCVSVNNGSAASELRVP